MKKPESASILSSIFDNETMGTWEWDIAAGIVRWSPALEDIHGIPRGSFAGTFAAYQSDIHPADREHVFSTIQKTLEARRDHRLEYRIVRPDGEVRWLEANGRVFCDARGEVESLVGVCMDVTERKGAELARLESEALLLTTMTSLGEAVIVTDAAGRVKLMNGVAEALTATLDPAVRGRPLADVLRLVDDRTGAPIESPVERARRRRRACELGEHALLVQTSGAAVAVDLRAAPIPGPDGALLGIVVVFRDASEERRETARRALFSQASALLAASLDPEKALETIARLAVPAIADWCTVDVLDPDNTFRRVATAHVDPSKVALADELFRRYPPRPGPGSLYDIVARGKPVLVPQITDEMMRAACVDDEHYRLVLELGRLASFLVVPIRVGERSIGAITAVTAESKRALQPRDAEVAEELARCAAISFENARLLHEAQRATQAREEVLAVVAHDLRNPLSAIMLKIELLRRVGLEGEERAPMRERAFEFVSHHGARMKRMIDDLVDTAAIESGSLRVELSPRSLCTIVEHAVDAASAQAHGRGLTLEAILPDDLGVVRCDADRLLQVLQNLVDNAIKVTPEGGAVRVRARRESDFVLVSVEDTGPGICEGSERRLFERFYKGDAGRRDGLGLGLFIARGIVEAHGGRIYAERLPGGGSAFSFRLPTP